MRSFTRKKTEIKNSVLSCLDVGSGVSGSYRWLIRTTCGVGFNFALYTLYRKTSAACFVSGVAALMLSANPSLTPSQIRQIIIQTSDTTNCHWITNYSVAGYNYGRGRLNAHAAVRAARLLEFNRIGYSSNTDIMLNPYRLATTTMPDNIEIPSTIELGGNTLTVARIASRGFENFRGHTISIPPTVTQIDGFAFNNTNATVRLLGGRTENQDNLFAGTMVRYVALPPNLSHIGNRAFAGFRGHSITIPFSVNTIGDNVFENSTSLRA